jgi:type I restriction enzyme S subunit
MGSKKIALVPKLRFPEFRDSEGWPEEALGPYLIDCSGKVPANTKLPVFSSTREGLVRQDAYFDGRVLQNKNDYGLVPRDCFVYRHMSDDGSFKFNINDTGGEIAVSKEYPVFRTDRLNSRFLLAKLNDSPDFRRFAFSQKAGGTRTRLYLSRLCEWKTPLPSLCEQQKIADCLTSAEELIAAQVEKIDALKVHKKGLMQQLFPRPARNQDGQKILPETKPRKRFPEFEGAGDWKIRYLGRIAENLDNLRVPITSSAREPGETPYYGASGIVDYVKNFIFNEDLLCVSEDGANLVARTYPIAFPISGKTWVNNHAHVLRFESRGAQKFVEVYLNYIPLDDFITGMAQPKLNKAMLDSIPIPHPDYPEQQRVADCLSSLEELIAAQSEKLENLKSHKQALMQQLFPSLEENTL